MILTIILLAISDSKLYYETSIKPKLQSIIPVLTLSIPHFTPQPDLSLHLQLTQIKLFLLHWLLNRLAKYGVLLCTGLWSWHSLTMVILAMA